MQDIFQEYADKVCSTCKAEECGKGICIVYGEGLKVQCVDYIRDESKINKTSKPLSTTAKHTNPVMRNII